MFLTTHFDLSARTVRGHLQVAQAGGVVLQSDKIGARLKRAGMRWTVAGANAIIALRCSKLSGRKRRLRVLSRI